MGPKNAVEEIAVFIDGNPVGFIGNIQISPQMKEKATCKIPVGYKVMATFTFRPSWKFRLWLWWTVIKLKIRRIFGERP